MHCLVCVGSWLVFVARRVRWCALLGVRWLVRVGWCTLVGGRWCALLVGAGAGRGGRAGGRAGGRGGGRRRRWEYKLKTKTPHHDVGNKKTSLKFQLRVQKSSTRCQDGRFLKTSNPKGRSLRLPLGAPTRAHAGLHDAPPGADQQQGTWIPGLLLADFN